MKAIIMAAGTYRTFDRKTIKLNDETLIDRIVRQLKQRNIDEIMITASYPGQHKEIKGTVEILNNLNGKDLGCLYGIKDIGADIYLYADVFYSENAIDKIVEGKTTYYGRITPSPLKKYGEFFAFRDDKKMWKVLDEAWIALNEGKIKRLWSWDLYAYHTEKWFIQDGEIPRKKMKREQYVITTDFTEINDWTDDFDSAEEVIKWQETFGGKHD